VGKQTLWFHVISIALPAGDWASSLWDAAAKDKKHVGFIEGLVIVSIFKESSGHCHANDFEPTPTLVQPASNSKLGSSL